MTENSSICIDVRKSLDVRLWTDADWKSEFIQQDAYTRLEGIIVARLTALSVRKPAGAGGDSVIDRRHNAITIHGTRGSGKTTFVLNAIAKLTGAHKNLIDLGVLDPTLIGSKENLFLLILHRIKARIESKCRVDPDAEPNGSWTKSLEKLAGGLCLLDGVGRDSQLASEQWEDAHYAMEQGLSKAAEGQELESNFHHMIECALKVLGGDAFILALDDIDTNFEQGWQVLETLRRYLTSPRLIIVLSGDMDLYAMLVRGRQWKQFPENLLKHDEAMNRTIGDMVGHLQGQYLQKILPPAYRIDLAMFRNIGGQIRVRGDSTKDDGEEVRTFLGRNVEAVAGYRNEGLATALNLIGRQPIRTILNILSLMDQNGIPMSGNATDAQNGKDDGQTRLDTLRRGLISQFTDILARLHTDSDEFYRIRGESFAADFARFLTRNLAWSQAHALPLDLDSEDLSLGLFVLSALAGGYRTAHALDYMLRICVFREVAVHYRPGLLNSPSMLIPAVNYLALTRPGSLLDLGRHMTVVLRAEDAPKPKALRSGTVLTLARRSRLTHRVISDLYGAQYTDKSLSMPCARNAPEPIRAFRDAIYQKTRGKDRTYRWLGEWYNRPDSLMDGLSGEMTGVVGLLFSRILKRTGERPTYAAIHNLLGALADMVAAPEKTSVILQNAAVIRTYEIPDFLSPGAPMPEEEEEEETEAERVPEPEFSTGLFVTDLRRWAEEMAATAPLPAPVMARVWSRFFYALGNLDENLTADRLYLGYVISRQIVLFLNALVVEETLYRQGSSAGLQLRNPLSEDQILIRNIDNFQNEIPFAVKFLQCPLLAVFLPHGGLCLKGLYDKPEALKVYYEISHGGGTVEFDSLYVPLNSVALPNQKGRPSGAARRGGGRRADTPAQDRLDALVEQLPDSSPVLRKITIKKRLKKVESVQQGAKTEQNPDSPPDTPLPEKV